MPLTTNPFHFGKAVSGDDFCPRPDLEDQLKTKLKRGLNVVAQGRRRMGKTSLLRRSASEISGYSELYIDLFGAKSLGEIVACFARSIAAVENSSRWAMALSTAFSFLKISLERAGLKVEIGSSSAVRLDSIDEIVDFIAKHRSGRWIVIVDEFQEILKAPDSTAIQGRLRSKIQFLKQTPFVFAGSTRNRMQDIFHHPNSPLLKSAETIDVGPIDRPTFATWLGARFAQGRRTMAPELVDQVFTLASDVPGDVQQLCAALWDVSVPGQRIGSATLRGALERIWAQEQRSNESVVEQATPFQFRCLLAQAHLRQARPSSREFLDAVDRPPSATVFKALGAFERDGVLMKIGRRFEFTDPFFREWLRARFPRY